MNWMSSVNLIGWSMGSVRSYRATGRAENEQHCCKHIPTPRSSSTESEIAWVKGTL